MTNYFLHVVTEGKQSPHHHPPSWVCSQPMYLWAEHRELALKERLMPVFHGLAPQEKREEKKENQNLIIQRLFFLHSVCFILTHFTYPH